MRPLTDVTPKPLLKVGGRALIEYCLENLAKAGFSDIVINVAYLGQQIMDYCGDGSRWDVAIRYSDEGETALETAGGIANALPLLGESPFLVVNADILFDYPLAELREQAIDLAHLIMIDNPPHHLQGDFCLHRTGRLSEHGREKLTFSGVGIYDPALFSGVENARPLKLRPVLSSAMRNGRVTGEHFDGLWMDIGTPQRLAEVNKLYDSAGDL